MYSVGGVSIPFYKIEIDHIVEYSLCFPLFVAPCVTNPCMNYGTCTWYDETPDDFFCSCQPPYDGEMCEYKENPCVWPAEPGICDQMIPRWYYDKFAQECLPFNYTGR